MKTKISIALCAAALLCSCGDESGSDRPDSPVAIGITAAPATGETVTRAGTPITNSTYQLGVIRKKTDYYAAMNTPYSYSQMALGWIAENPVRVKSAPVTLYGYYPYQPADGDYVGLAGEGTTFRVKAQPYSAAQDMCCAPGTGMGGNLEITSSNYQVLFALKHVYARLKLTLGRGSEYSGAGNITSLTIRTGGKFYIERMRDVTTSTTQGGSLVSSGYVYPVPDTLPDEEAIVTYDFLLPSQPLTDNRLSVSLLIDGIERTVSIPLAGNPASLAEGTYYGLTLKVQDATIDITGVVTIDDYADQTNENIDGDI